MILEGAMIVIACITLTIPHPGVGFKGTWATANFNLRGPKSSAREMESGKVTPPQKYEGASRET